MGDEKNKVLKKLRNLGIMQIEITEGSGEKLGSLKDKFSLLESALFQFDKKALKKAKPKKIAPDEALSLAKEILSFSEEKKNAQAELVTLRAELARLKLIGELDPKDFEAMAEKGIPLSLYEMPKAEFQNLDERVKTVTVTKTKASVIFLALAPEEESDIGLDGYTLRLPQLSTAEIRQRVEALEDSIKESDEKIASYACYADGIKAAIAALSKEIEFETYATGMENEDLSTAKSKELSVSYFSGYIEAENLDMLKKTAKENSWGLISEDPTPEDDVPTKLKNNKFVSLIYPLTDFLGTVPGYFEYDISGWFLSFILIFFGIIFGDGGYGLLISAVVLAAIIKSLVSKKPVSPTIVLIGLFGISTVVWGTLTCTWFGLSPEQLPEWLKGLSVPLISNVYADKLWYPFWTNGEAGLTTAQNLQIFCFLLALVQLVVAHIKVSIRNRRSLKIIGDIGSILQLVGMFYLVLSFVVNPEVFSFSLVIGGIPVGTVAIALIATGFVFSFIFANYEGSVIKSIATSLSNIVTVLLGVVNVFSDIVSYIRLWAVGLAGAAISATVNELAGPLLGNFMFMIVAIIILVFGHGLNMILNVLSVVVHGIRLNTLEFSTHLDMSWSGHKFKPFNEQIDNKGE